jgi:CRP-like cAMP-binding protein
VYFIDPKYTRKESVYYILRSGGVSASIGGRSNSRRWKGIALSSIQRPPNQLLQALSVAEFDWLRPRLRPFEMVRDAVLTESGVASTHIYLPHSGAISLVVSLSEGQAVAVAMIGRDSVVGASESLGNDVAALDAIVLFPGAASIVDIADFRTIAGQSAEFRNLLARHEQAIFAQCQQSAACNAAHSVEARLSRWLLRARDLWDGTTLPMTQELLARLIGVQRNAISIVAHSLQQDGIISYSRGRIEIVNSQALEATACECYQTVTARYEHLLLTAHGTQR